MDRERFVALGLAQVGSSWFREVARWATSASIPVEFVKCVSVEEARARLASGRPFSALLVDAGLAGLDRDLADTAREHACALLVVDDGRTTRDWTSLGVSGVLPSDFDRGELLDALSDHARVIGGTDASPGESVEPDEASTSGWRGQLVAITGPGGTGASTAAMALAQGLGEDVRYTDMVALVDLALHADLAMLHDARDVVPGVQELIDAHRSGRPSPNEIRALTYDVVNRRYHLLLGLRRHRDWTALRPRAFEAAVDGLRRTYRLVVADVDADVEGEDHTGSVDIEERNLMARTTIARADAVVVVGQPGAKGLHSLVRTVRTLQDFGVEPARLLPVLNRAPRSAPAKAELARAYGELVGRGGQARAGAGPVFLPDRRRLDEVIRDGARLHSTLVDPLVGALHAVLTRVPAEPPQPDLEPVAVAPGSLGTWAEETTAS